MTDDADSRSEPSATDTDSRSEPSATDTDSRSEPPETDATQGEQPATDDPTVPMSSTTQSDLVDAARLRQLLEYGLLAVFVLVALFAGLGVYSQVGRAVEIWVADAYEPVAKAAVNLALLLIAVAGVSRQLSRLAGRARESDGDGE